MKTIKAVVLKSLSTVVLLLILMIENATCHSKDNQIQTFNNNGMHQSVSNDGSIALEIADRMKDETKTEAIANELFASSSAKPEVEFFECGSPENLHKGYFSLYDYFIVCGMLVISLGIGAFYGFFHKSSLEKSASDFLLGTGMTVLPVTLSLTTSFITAIELLGNPSEVFYQGTQFALIVIPMLLVIPVAVMIFYPIYFKLELTSCYEYLGIRFGKDIRLLGATLYIIQMSFYTAVAVLAPAIALSKATGLNTRLAVILIYLVCIFYSSQGGMKAVVIADTFQACVLAVSLILVVILGHIYTDGLGEIFETAFKNDRLELFNFDPNLTTRHTVFSVVIGGFFYWTSLFCTNQASVQKCMSLKQLKLAQIALTFAILGLVLVFLINFYTGIMVYTKYTSCDPLTFGRIQAKDQLLPFYVMDVFEPFQCITGIFVAGIFAASLGTVASALNSLSAVTCEDLLQNGFNIKIRPEKGATYAKWMSLGYGIFSFVLVFIVERLGGVLQATLTLNGLVGGVTLGLFVLGVSFKRANAKGAFYGGLIALAVVIYIGIMAQITSQDPESLALSLENCDCYEKDDWSTLSKGYGGDATLTINSGRNVSDISSSIQDGSKNSEGEFGFSIIYRISYMWYSAIGAILTIILGLLISIITDIVTKRRVLKITNKRKPSNVEVNVIIEENSLCIGAQKPFKNEIKTKFSNEKPGIDNFTVKIDDEK